MTFGFYVDSDFAMVYSINASAYSTKNIAFIIDIGYEFFFGGEINLI